MLEAGLRLSLIHEQFGLMDCPECCGRGQTMSQQHVCHTEEDQCEHWCPQWIVECCPRCGGDGTLSMLEVLANE